MTCNEERADPPLQKENANFCDFFSPRFGAFDGTQAEKSTQARNDLDALFDRQADPLAAEDGGDGTGDEAPGRDGPLSDEELARKMLDDLFK